MTRRLMLTLVCVLTAATLAQPAPAAADEPIQISGRYPHLTMWNRGGECGVGAVVPWADRLWVITYSPHMPKGSDDKLYEIDADLNLTIRPESIGGTPANRMIHRESNQLFIGPYVIDGERNVRVIPYDVALGRPTANARHLTDPAGKVYLFTMEEGLYEIDAKSLDVTTLMLDGHAKGWVDPLPGYHGKGGYTGQGRLVVANNGEKQLKWKEHPYGPSGVLAETTDPNPDKTEWTVVERAQFTEVTGPGGIYGNADADDPLWALGWDKRSALLMVLDGGKWRRLRLPMSDFSYIASHGWYTEWPRIGEIAPAAAGKPARLLGNIHGGWFSIPQTLSGKDIGGVAPIGSYLKITGDITHWQGRIVFGCDDTAITGGNQIAGQSHSNLWFTDEAGLRRVGQPVGWGGVWIGDDAKANTPSDPYLMAGYTRRVIHLAHDADEPVWFTVETDADGTGEWTTIANLEVPAHGYVWHAIPDDAPGVWLRVRTNRAAPAATVYLHYGVSAGAVTDRAMFDTLVDADSDAGYTTGIMRPRGEDTHTLHMVAKTVDATGNVTHTGYYEIGDDLKLVHKPDESDAKAYVEDKAKVDAGIVRVDRASVVVSDHNGRFRLPRSLRAYDVDSAAGPARQVREVVTERTLLNAHGTIYVNPDHDSIGFRGLKPVTTHGKRIGDFCSWKGLLVLTGLRADAKTDVFDGGHTIVSDDGKAAIWVGDIDDLWKLGKPRGEGGPWAESAVKPGEPSDPYLMTGYDKKRVTLSHDADQPVKLTVEVDVDRMGVWREYATFTVKPGEKLEHAFPAHFAAHWVRVKADRACKATAWFVYE